MKLDWNLMRVILAHIEAETIEQFLKDADKLSDWKEGQLLSERSKQRQDAGYVVVMRHIKLLSDGGYIENVGVKESIDGHYTYYLGANPSLTLDGYSLLTTLRTDGFLDKLTEFAKQKAVPLSIDTIKTIATACISAILN